MTLLFKYEMYLHKINLGGKAACPLHWKLPKELKVFRYYPAVKDLAGEHEAEFVKQPPTTACGTRQVAVITHLCCHNDRQICFLVDEQGDKMKTILAKIIQHRYSMYTVPCLVILSNVFRNS